LDIRYLKLQQSTKMTTNASTKILFLDRDGVINHDPDDYTKNAQELTILPTVPQALRYAHAKGYTIVVITNQAGIGKRLYTHTNVNEIHDVIQACAQQAGAHIAAFYYCPHNPHNTLCLCRKPNNIMIQKALARYQAAPHSCLMVGDKLRDVQCAQQTNVPAVLMPCNGDLLEILEAHLA
jgi:D-glycero-D-manno-heptose 1,7-bisphosphate phosphatase